VQPAGYVDCAGPDRPCGFSETGLFMVSCKMQGARLVVAG
jgi:hypothetical protein